MAQYDFQVADYERIFRKRYKIVLLTIVLAVIFSVMFANTRVPMYRASATVKVDRTSMLGMGMEQMMYGVWDNIETQTKVITSFPVLLRAAKQLHMIPDSVKEDNLPSDDKLLATIDGLRGKISTALNTGTNIIQIMAVSSNPEEARDMANTVAFAYKNASLAEKQLNATKTKSFVQEQLDKCNDALNQAEHDVEAFEEIQKVPSLDLDEKAIIDKSAKLQTDIDAADEAIALVRSQRNSLEERKKKGYDGTKITLIRSSSDSTSTGGKSGWVSVLTDQDPAIAQLNSRLVDLQFQLDDLHAYYKASHPGIKEVEKKIEELIGQVIQEYDRQEQDLVMKRDKLTEDKALVDRDLQKIPGNEMEYVHLERKVKVNDELHTLLVKKLQEAQIAEAGVVDDVTIMSMAMLPHAAINKDLFRMALIGVFLGLILGIIIAIIREMFDTSIGTIEDVERTLKITVLAVIPHIQFEEQKQKNSKDVKREDLHSDFRARLVTQFDPKKPTAEAYRILRTNLDYLAIEHPIKTLLVTSATMQEGKSTTIGNLAVVFAQAGKKVLLLGCNLRRPSLYKMFGVEKGPGIADILIDKAKWQDCVKTVTDLALGEFTMEEILTIPGLENLNIITYGQTPPNPAELLSSSKMDELVNDVKNYFDIVLVDGPPLLPVADSIVLSTKTDAVVLVHKVGSAARNSLTLSKERLATVQARLLGVILNDIRPETSGITYTYMYSRYYGKDVPRKRRHNKVLGFLQKS